MQSYWHGSGDYVTKGDCHPYHAKKYAKRTESYRPWPRWPEISLSKILQKKQPWKIVVVKLANLVPETFDLLWDARYSWLSKSKLKIDGLFNKFNWSISNIFTASLEFKSLLYSHNKHYYKNSILNSKNDNRNCHSSPKNFVFLDKFSSDKPNQFQIYFDHCTAVQEN